MPLLRGNFWKKGKWAATDDTFPTRMSQDISNSHPKNTPRSRKLFFLIPLLQICIESQTGDKCYSV